MAFNLRQVIVEDKGSVIEVKTSKELKEERVVRKRMDSSLFVIYLMKNYHLSCKTDRKEYNLRVWSKVDRRYCLNIYTDDLDSATLYAYKQYKRKNCIIVDVKEASQKELNEKFDIRF